MPTDSLHLFLTMFALVGALLLFALLLLFGTRLVKWLGLPTDLPEGPRFEPPAPPHVQRGDRQQAAIAAQAQAKLRAVYDLAHTAARAAFETQEIHTQVVAAGKDEPFVKAAAITETSAATAKSADAIVEKAFLEFDKKVRENRALITDADITTLQSLIDTHLVAIQGALTNARTAIEPLGDGGGNKRVIVMVVVLVVMIAWVILMKTMLKT